MPELLVYHDSFYYQLSKFLEPHFGRITALSFSKESGYWNLDWIRSESPDVVIIEFTERYLDFIFSLVEEPEPASP